jgi:hypothetical protein
MSPRGWVFAPRPCSVLDERGRVERGFHDSDSGWEILESFEVRQSSILVIFQKLVNKEKVSTVRALRFFSLAV